MLKHLVNQYFCFFSSFSSCFFYQREGQAANLPDIPSTAAIEINYLLGKEIITGYEDGTFKPTRNVTRAEAAIMLGRALGLDGTQRATSFMDVSASSEASGYIQSAVIRELLVDIQMEALSPLIPLLVSKCLIFW